MNKQIYKERPYPRKIHLLPYFFWEPFGRWALSTPGFPGGATEGGCHAPQTNAQTDDAHGRGNDQPGLEEFSLIPKRE
jgi:hypothetical protein